jgi:hypothetical protein
MGQVAGVSRLEYTEGPERGVEVVRVRTGSGLDFDVLPGRGLDIAHASYQGIPLSWMSATGIPHAAFFEAEGLGWLRGFYGGLMVTCGLLNAGSPGPDAGHHTPYSGVATEDFQVVKLGLHGRASNTPARYVAADACWVDDEEYLLVVSGRVREATVFGEHIELERSIEAALGQSHISVHDQITNHGHDSQPLMVVYHCNFGWPVVAPTSRLVLSAERSEPRDPTAAPGLPQCRRFEPPQASYPEQVFYHTMLADDDGAAHAALINDALRGGFGVGLTYDASALDQFTQWKCMKRGTYVCGLEPGNCRVQGRAAEREAGRLKHLEPGESVEYELLFEILDGPEACADFVEITRR